MADMDPELLEALGRNWSTADLVSLFISKYIFRPVFNGRTYTNGWSAVLVASKIIMNFASSMIVYHK